jgi:hypothetical protein
MIAAYCWPQSAGAGETVSLFCHTEGVQVRCEVVRCGADDQLLTTEVLPGTHQHVPDDAGPRGCRWQPSLDITVPPEWPSGFYLVRLTDESGSAAEAFFVVRSTEPKDVLFVLATSTWAAYNAWGAPSFYTGAYASSLQRPLPKGMLYQSDPQRFRVARYLERSREDQDAIRQLGYEMWTTNAGWANWESLFARWAEGQGYALGYATSQDLDRDPDLLAGYPAYVSVGHDEYWTAGMRDAVEQYVDGGGNAAFFSGNTAFWQARFEDDYACLVCHKTGFENDPVYIDATQESVVAQVPGLTTMWSDPLVGRPEHQMTGVTFTRGGYARMPNSPYGSGGYTICRPDHWAFTSLGFNAGDTLGAGGIVVGYECDGCEMGQRDGLPYATGRDGTPTNFEILGTAPARLWETSEAPAVLGDDFIGELNWVAGRIGGADNEANRERFADGHAVLGAFQRGRGEVFTTGCTDWAYGLDQPDVATVTRNVLDRFTRGKR